MDKKSKPQPAMPSFEFIRQEIDKALENCPPDKKVSVVFNTKQPFMTITQVDKED